MFLVLVLLGYSFLAAGRPKDAANAAVTACTRRRSTRACIHAAVPAGGSMVVQHEQRQPSYLPPATVALLY